MATTPGSLPTLRTDAIFHTDLRRVLLRTDRLFCRLLIGQWVFAVGVALVWSPRTWIAQYWTVHQHVVAAVILGGLFAAYPLWLIRRHPGAPLTRHVIAVGQMLQSALLVHVTGGRIETHFHVFGSLALLAFYRDWRVLLTGSAVVYLDHLALGIWFPLSVYGVPVATLWRAAEHAFWVGFEVIFLAMACRTGLRELRAVAERQTAVEVANQDLEARVAERTTDLTQAKEAFQEHVLRLEVLTKELARSNEELEQFAYVASHDLQEPLRMVASYTGLLARRYQDRLDAQANEFIAFAVDGTVRMQTLIHDLLEYSRVSRGARPVVPTDCEAVLQQVLRDLQPAVEESHAAVTHDPLPIVKADPRQLAQVFQNLLSNAIKFRAQEPPRVHVGAERRDGAWMFSVRDNGIGIDPRYAERIFHIFQRLHTRTEYPGTGIGLALCHKIVERHGGTIWVESHPGRGATFFFTLPSASDAP